MVEIKGLQKMSLIDFPGRVACVVFLPGCNFRCPFCQNPDLFSPEKLETVPEKEFFKFLQGRKNWLDGVAITGGEPTVHPDLPDFIMKIKAMGYQVNLETNGTNPKMLERLIGDRLLDYIAMDIKGPPERYSEISGARVNVQDVQKSIDLIRSSGIEYEFRTTVVPGLVEKKDMEKIGEWLHGAEQCVIHNFRPKACLDKTFESKPPYSKEGLEEIAKVARMFFKTVRVRG